MPRYQKKKIRAAMVQTQVPVGMNMKRRTSSTITQDEAIRLGKGELGGVVRSWSNWPGS